MSELGDRLAELRLDKQEKQQEIAELLHVSSASVSNYETGVHLPNVDALCQLADHFNVTTDYLMGRTNCRIPTEVLNRPFSGQTTCGTLLAQLMELPEGKRNLLLEIIEDMRVSCYLKKHTDS